MQAILRKFVVVWELVFKFYVFLNIERSVLMEEQSEKRLRINITLVHKSYPVHRSPSNNRKLQIHNYQCNKDLLNANLCNCHVSKSDNIKHLGILLYRLQVNLGITNISSVKIRKLIYVFENRRDPLSSYEHPVYKFKTMLSPSHI